MHALKHHDFKITLIASDLITSYFSNKFNQDFISDIYSGPLPPITIQNILRFSPRPVLYNEQRFL